MITTASHDASPGRGRPRRAGGSRRGEVLDAVIRVIAERGIESTRFADISEAAGVAVSTLQYWFGAREDMLVEAFLHMHRRDVARVEEIAKLDEDPWRRLEHLIRFDLGQAAEQPTVDRRGWMEFWRAALRDEEIRAESERVYDWWRRPFLAAIHEGISRKMFDPVTTPEAIVTYIMAALDGVTVPLLLRHGYFDPVAFADDLLAQLAALLRFRSASLGAPVTSSRRNARAANNRR